jgi:hypothetical protein
VNSVFTVHSPTTVVSDVDLIDVLKPIEQIRKNNVFEEIEEYEITSNGNRGNCLL